MALTDHEIAVRQAMYEDSTNLMRALEGLQAIQPRRCLVHDQPISDCYDEGEECDPKSAVLYPNIMLQNFVLTARWVVPGKDVVHDEKIYSQTVAPGMDLGDTLGLLSVLEG